MSLLLQDLCEWGVVKPDPNIYVIKVQNVADYIYTQSEKENWDDRDFPNLAPAFDSMWFEWRTPPVSNSGGTILKMPVQPREGVHLVSIDSENEAARMGLITGCASIVLGREVDAKTWTDRFGKTPNCRWICVALPVSEYQGKIIQVGMGVYGVATDGHFQRYSDAAQYAILTKQPIADYGGGKEIGTRINVGLFPPFLAMSYMHCRNVTVAKSAPTPTALARRRAKDGKAPILRYHTIKIDAMGRKTSYPAADAGLGGEKPLHICRGHFKVFKEKKLFGKWEGTYWWPMQARGNAERGTVVADYAVNTKGPAI